MVRIITRNVCRIRSSSVHLLRNWGDGTSSEVATVLSAHVVMKARVEPCDASISICCDMFVGDRRLWHSRSRPTLPNIPSPTCPCFPACDVCVVVNHLIRDAQQSGGTCRRLYIGHGKTWRFVGKRAVNLREVLCHFITTSLDLGVWAGFRLAHLSSSLLAIP